MIDKPRNDYASARDFKERTLRLGEGDPDAKLYDSANETLVWMKDVARTWGNAAENREACPHVLEIGCGHGRWAKHLENHYLTYVGIDPVAERIESAKARYSSPRAHFFHEPVPLKPGHRYNAPAIVFAVDVLQHLGLEEALGLMQRVAALLPIGGRFVTWDGCLGDWTREQCEAAYAKRPEHMIPKPLSAFREAIPELDWQTVDGTRLIAVKQ